MEEVMLNKNEKNNTEQVQMVSVEQLVPKDHILRKIDKYIDFNFIYDLVEDKYSQTTGRPSIDPVVLIKLVILQYFFNIYSMRKTIREVEVNIAYRWFLGLDFYDKVPHFSTFGKNYERRFKNTDIFNQIFENILNQAMSYGFVDAKIQFVDSTHVKAHANRHKNQKVKIKKKVKSYQRKLEYDETNDCYICPENKILLYSTTNREGYRIYKSKKSLCENCPSLSKCTKSKSKAKVIIRHIWQEYIDYCEWYRLTKAGKSEYKQRKETIERQFGSAK